MRRCSKGSRQFPNIIKFCLIIHQKSIDFLLQNAFPPHISSVDVRNRNLFPPINHHARNGRLNFYHVGKPPTNSVRVGDYTYMVMNVDVEMISPDKVAEEKVYTWFSLTKSPRLKLLKNATAMSISSWNDGTLDKLLGWYKWDSNNVIFVILNAVYTTITARYESLGRYRIS